jgi:hypothetical protein
MEPIPWKDKTMYMYMEETIIHFEINLKIMYYIITSIPKIFSKK